MREYFPPKPMKQIGDLFERYKKNLKAPQATVEKVCIEVIKKECGFDIDMKQLEYTVSTRTMYLRVPSLLSSELKLHRQQILNELKKRLGENGSPKVIL